MPVHATSIKPSTRHIRVDRRLARLLKRGLRYTGRHGPRRPRRRAPEAETIAICSWASRQEDPARALICWAAKHRRGRHRRCAGAGTGRPSRNRRRHSRGQDIAAPRTVAPERRDDSLRGLADVGVLGGIATRLGMSQMADFELPDAAILAYTMSEAVADQEPDPDAYLRGFLDELLTLEPGLRQHVSDLLTTELKEAIAQTDPDQASAAIRLIERAEERWRNDDR